MELPCWNSPWPRGAVLQCLAFCIIYACSCSYLLFLHYIYIFGHIFLHILVTKTCIYYAKKAFNFLFNWSARNSGPPDIIWTRLRRLLVVCLQIKFYSNAWDKGTCTPHWLVVKYRRTHARIRHKEEEECPDIFCNTKLYFLVSSDFWPSNLLMAMKLRTQVCMGALCSKQQQHARQYLQRGKTDVILEHVFACLI